MGEHVHEDGLGGSITIIEAGDDRLPMRFRMVLPKNFGPPAPEMHPHQRETIEVLRGELDLGTIDGERVVLRPKERFTLEPGTFHHPQNRGDTPCEFEATLAPGLDSASMFTHLYTETREHRGLAQLLRVATVFRKHRRVIAFKPPLAGVMAVLAGLGRMVGVRLTEVSRSRSAEDPDQATS